MRGRDVILTAIAAVSLGSWAGCGGGDAPAPQAQNDAAGQAAPAAASSAAATPPTVSTASLADADAYQTTGGPQEVLTQYLQAVKMQDTRVTYALLTGMARQRAHELNIDVTPPGNEAAEFRVGRMEFVNDGQTAAHVESAWIETDITGEQSVLQSIWVMAQEENGWRIAGVVVKLFGDGEPPLVLNYEDPEEVVYMLGMAREEIARRSQASAEPAAPVFQADGSQQPPAGRYPQQQ